MMLNGPTNLNVNGIVKLFEIEDVCKSDYKFLLRQIKYYFDGVAKGIDDYQTRNK